MNIQQTLKEHWIKSVKLEEEKSLVIWEKRKEWFQKLPEETTENQPERQQPNDVPRGTFRPNMRRQRRANQRPSQRNYTRIQSTPQVQNNRLSYAHVVKRGTIQGTRRGFRPNHNLRRPTRTVSAQNNRISVQVHGRKFPRNRQWQPRNQWDRESRQQTHTNPIQDRQGQRGRFGAQRHNQQQGGPFLNKGPNSKDRWKGTPR